MIKEKILYEFMETSHLKQRLEERAFNIKDISLPGIEIDNKIKDKIKEKISLGIKKRISEIRSKNFPNDRVVVYKLIIPLILYKGKRLIPKITTESKNKAGALTLSTGSLFIMPFVKNIGTTIMNVDEKLSDGNLTGKQKYTVMNGGDEEVKKFQISVESYPKIYYQINLDEEIKYPAAQTGEESQLGAFLLSQLKDISNYNPKEEKSIKVLEKNLTQITGLYNRNEERFNVSETNQILSKINQIKRKIENLSGAPEKAASNIAQKGDYRAGRTYVHKDFGKGVISSVKSIGDGFYNILVKFPEPYGFKTLRVKEKEKPEAVASGLSESLRVKIRTLIRQLSK